MSNIVDCYGKYGILSENNYKYGVLGTYAFTVDNTDYYIGDIVIIDHFGSYHYKTNSVIVKCTYGAAFVMGSQGVTSGGRMRNTTIKKIKSYTNILPNESLRYGLHCCNKVEYVNGK